MSTLVTLTIVGLLAVGSGWLLVRTFQAPAVEPVRFEAADGTRAQQKLFELARGRSRSGPVVLSEAEINAFVTRHLDPVDLPLHDPVIRLRDAGLVDIAGTVPLERVMRESPLAAIADALPSRWLATPVWLSVSASPTLTREPRPTLRLDARRVELGRQRVPTVALRLLLDPASLRFTRITLPPAVRAVRIERGRVVIETTSPLPRT